MLVVSHLLVAAVFGSMLFFSFLMAPLIFTQLEEGVAGRFIRTVFPWYYLVIGILGLGAGVFLFRPAPLEAGMMLGVASLAVVTRQFLLPIVNGLRDRELTGDQRAGKRFNQLHRLTVLINMVQLVAVTLVLILLARS